MTTPVDLAAVDGVPVVFAALLASEPVMALIDDEPARISGDVVAPFPRYRIEASQVVWDPRLYTSTHDIRVSAYGTREGGPGDSALMHMVATALGVLFLLDQQVYGPGQPVVTNIAQYLPLTPLPEPGHIRWQAGVRLSMHPPAVSLAG